MSIKPTLEQEKIFKAIHKRPENVLIKAYAGCGKTSTVVEAVKLIPKDKSITFLAFNKHIQEELKLKLPEYVRCYTTYGLGNGAIKRKYGDKITFDEFKIDKIINSKLKSFKLEDEFKNQQEIYSYIGKLKKLVNLCRVTLTIKPSYIPNLAGKHDINITKSNDIKRVLKILDTATNDRKTYDFTDMIYLPAIDKSLWMFPQDYVFIDEIQDFNMCQIRIIEKILKRNKTTGEYTGRLIMVGDSFQNIYGFNGAGESSFKWFENFPNTKQYKLSTSFRCSKNVIKKAQEIVPDIKALDSAPEGSVRSGNVLKEAESGDFVLCRKTTPLIKLFFEFLRLNKKVMIKGNDIGVDLIDLIGKISGLDTLRTFWNTELEKYRSDLRVTGILNPNEHSGYAALEDKVTALLFLSELSDSVMDLKGKIKSIFSDNIEGIVLSTVHKVKGLEADRVFIVRPDLLPMPSAREWQQIEEKNIEYVAITRAKVDLIYDHEWTDEEEK